MSAQRLGLRRERAMLGFQSGRYLEAEHDLSEVIDGLGGSSEPNAHYELGRALVDRATVRRILNRWSDAEADLDACEELLPSLGRMAATSLRTNIDSMRAQLHLTVQAPQHDPSQAERILDDMAAGGTGGWWVREAEANRAFRTGDWERAATAYAEVAEATRREGWAQAAAASALRAGTALIELGRPEDAGPRLDEAIAFFAELGPSDLLADTERQLARLRALEGRPDDAWAHMQTALSIVETSFRRFRSLHDEQRFLADKGAYYQHAFAVALTRGGVEGKLARAGGRRALEELLSVPAACERRHAALRRRRSGRGRPPAGARGSARRAPGRAVRDRRCELRARGRRRRAGRAVRQDHARAPRAGRAARTPPPFDPEATIAGLPPAWSVLSMFWLGTELHMFLARPGEPPVHRRERWSADHLERLRTSQASLRTAQDRDLFFHGPVIPAELALLVAPEDLVRRIPAGDRLLVSPHGALRGVPIHAAGDGEGSLRGRSVQYIPSLALLGLARPPAGAAGVLLVGCEQDGFGDPPLTGVPDELARVAQEWASSPETAVDLVLLGQHDQVGVETAAGWGRYRVVQIACHGEFDPARPLDAALRLGRSALRTSELFALRLQAELVCLSACDLGGLGTGLAEVGEAGDEWLGVTMPLLHAGARAVLVSLWKANDAVAARLMPELHAAIRDGCEPADALQAALSAIAGEDDVYWGNWYLVGFHPGSPYPHDQGACRHERPPDDRASRRRHPGAARRARGLAASARRGDAGG